MASAYSKLTTQNQTSVPASVRRKLGLVPGSVLQWEQVGEELIVRMIGRHSSEDIHRAAFPMPPKSEALIDKKEGVRQYIKRRHTR